MSMKVGEKGGREDEGLGEAWDDEGGGAGIIFWLIGGLGNV